MIGEIKNEFEHFLKQASREEEWVLGEKEQKSFEGKIKELIHASAHREILEKEVFGFGPLESFIKEDAVTEIIINGFDRICVEKDGRLLAVPDQFLNQWSFERFLQKITEDAQVKLDLEHPFASFTWKDFRVHLCHPPLSHRHHLVTMRRIHRKNRLNLENMVQSGSCTKGQAELLTQGVRDEKNILVVGGTGSGKTTLLSALLQELPETERLLLLEDTDEIPVPNPISAKLLTREKSPALDAFDLGDLLKQSLRMRPDRLVVGEVRGGEAKDLLMSLSTGHEGSFATLHAASAQEALLRLEMLIQMGAPHWNVQSIRKLIALTVNWIVVVERSLHQRKIEGVYELTSLESIGFLTQKLA